MTEKSIKDDIIWGIKAIAHETNQTPRQAYRQIELKLLPVGKLGGRIFASKQALKEHFEKKLLNKSA